jgi:pSer/pThr/pTyr-binding forkhead associated (FHA) protein
MGRAQDAGLRVNHPTVSRRHSRVTLNDDATRLTIEDLGGANGTFVNGVGIEGARPLVGGDTITLGEVTLLVAFREG